MLFALLVFTVQGYLVQTHIHASPPVVQRTIIHALSPDAPSPTDPGNSATCFLCQEIVHAGAFVLPSPVALPLQLDWIVFVTPSAIAEWIAVHHSLSWQSRAPPRR